MADGISIDTSELRQLAADLMSAPARVVPKVEAVVDHGGLNIKKQLIDEMSASVHFKPIAATIDYDVTGANVFGTGIIEAEIGPNKERKGGRNRGRRRRGRRRKTVNESDFYGGGGSPASLAGIAYFGGARGGGGRVPDPQGALDAEEPKFVKALEDVLGEETLP